MLLVAAAAFADVIEAGATDAAATDVAAATGEFAVATTRADAAALVLAAAAATTTSSTSGTSIELRMSFKLSLADDDAPTRASERFLQRKFFFVCFRGNVKRHEWTQ